LGTGFIATYHSKSLKRGGANIARAGVYDPDTERAQAFAAASGHSVCASEDEVIASALARRARLAAGVTQEQVVVVVSKRAVVVNLRPTSGVPLDHDAIKTAIEQELQAMAPNPLPQVRVNIAVAGVIGV